MKALHMISGGDSGGAKTHVFALMDELTKMMDVKIVCFTEGVFYNELKDKNIPYELLKQKNRFDMSVLTHLAKMIKDEGYDIIHAHGARANFIAAKLKKRVPVPVVTTVHSDYLMDFDGIYKKILFTSLNVLALKKMDYYIAVSSDFKRMLIDRGFRPNSIYTVYNGMNYDSEIKFDTKEQFAKRIGITPKKDEVFVGIIGRHEFVKGHDIFVRAAKIASEKNENIRFLIAGNQEGEQELRELVRTLGIEDKVIFTGFINDIYSFINFTDINVLSSRSESFPYVLMEGARMKKATISSAVGGIPDLIINNRTGLLFENENYEELAKCILKLASDKECADRLGQALYERATGNFSNKNLAQTHTDIYRAILRDRKEKKKYDAVLSGYYGFHNSGDDALLFAICKGLKEYIPDIRLAVFSAKPSETRKIYSMDAVYRFSPFAVIRTLKQSKMLINGGGSLIQDATSSHSLWYYLTVMKRAKKYGAKLCVYANGIGPIKEQNRSKAARVLKGADMITLRDQNSVQELKLMGIDSDKYKVTADPAILLDGTSSTEIDHILKKENIPTDKKYIGVSVREWEFNDKNFEAKIADILDRIAEKYSLIPVFIPMRLQPDSKISMKIKGFMKNTAYVLTESYSVNDVIGIVARCEMVIGMRLHTLIYAATAAVPAIGLVYDPKIQGFLEYLGQYRCISSKNIDTQKMLDFICDIEENYDQIKNNLIKRTKELHDKAKQNAEMAANLLR